MNIAHLLLGSAREFRDLPALARGTAPHLTYRDLWRKVSVMSMHLRGRFGLERGDRVAFAMSNGVESIEVMYAIWHAGLCAVPMNAKLHAREFAFILENSGAKLCFVTPDLAATIAEQFSTTLMAVDREFGLFFQRLFNGGQASLRTSDDAEDPGIEIYARPPGKRIGSLAQLSGGERALTATALLLAILRVKPAPFCVLDEVDAALDERNVGRFTQALRELTDRTQFVVITHNRGTIEAADMLYGVSMDDGGVSKVISLKLSELDEQRERAG